MGIFYINVWFISGLIIAFPFSVLGSKTNFFETSCLGWHILVCFYLASILSSISSSRALFSLILISLKNTLLCFDLNLTQILLFLVGMITMNTMILNCNFALWYLTLRDFELDEVIILDGIISDSECALPLKDILK